jgi:hypothetical protein
VTVGLLIASIGSTYEEVVVEPGHQPALLLLAAFGITFGVTRFVTHSIRSERFSWLGDIEAGETHIHHLVWGIVLLLGSGVLAVIVEPPLEVTAIVFGVGAALTLDEFALWLHLDDVYWSEQGRQSIDAVIVFAVATGFMVIGVYPLSIGDDDGGEGVVGLVVSHAIGLALAIVCALKGKLMWAVVGVYVSPVALIGAWRLAKPGSWWAGRRYDEAKLARARERYAGEETVHKPAVG